MAAKNPFRLVNRNHYLFETLRRMGMVCYYCYDQMYSELEEAPGHIVGCDECHMKNEQKSKYLTNKDRDIYT